MGGVYAVFAVAGPPAFSHPAIKLLMPAILILIPYFKSKARLVRLFLTFYATGFLFAGAVLGINLIARQNTISMVRGIPYVNIPVGILLLVAGVTYLAAVVLYRSFAKPGKSVKVCARVFDSVIDFTALMDTGNTLRHPLNNRPVLVAEWSVLRPAFPENMAEIIEQNTPDKAVLLLNSPGFSIMPYKTVGTEFALILTFCPKSLTINNKRADCHLGISFVSLADDGAYSGLVGSV